MNFDNIKDVVTSKTARQVLLTQKHSPKILFAAGVVGVVGTVVLACRGTLKMDDVLETHEKHVQWIGEEAGTEAISHENADKQIKQAKIKVALEIAKLYAPAVGLGVISIGALTGSHVVLSKRNTGVMAAYAGLDKAYKQYRKNVVDKFGAEADQDLVKNSTMVDVEEKTLDGKTKITSVKKDGDNGGTPYTVLFSESTSKRFTREPGVNAMLLSTQQSYANDKLRANGHLFLNEVFDMLGLPHTPAGAVTGWVWRRDTEEMNGDNFVDFGIYANDLERANAFVNGDEDSVWLDFNVDGVIYNLI